MPRLSANSYCFINVRVTPRSLHQRQRFDTYLCNGVLDDLLIRHITLVAHQQLVHTLCSVAIDLLKPLLDIVERIHICHIVDNADAVCSAIVGGCDGSESLLTCGIPLALISASADCSERLAYVRSEVLLSCRPARSCEFSVRACQPFRFRDQRRIREASYKVDTNGGNITLSVCIIGKSEQ